MSRTQIRHIIKGVNKNGLKWKKGKDKEHLEKRIRRCHIPQDFTIEAFESIIIDIIRDKENETNCAANKNNTVLMEKSCILLKETTGRFVFFNCGR